MSSATGSKRRVKCSGRTQKTASSCGNERVISGCAGGVELSRKDDVNYNVCEQDHGGH
jgi:hypothetical protein